MRSVPSGFVACVAIPGESFQSRVLGVAQPASNEPNTLPDVRCADARSRQTDRCKGVADSFQVILYKVEPAMPNCRFNLLTKDDWRIALADEVVERWPKVPLVSKPSAFACRAERLAWRRSGPDLTIFWPAGEVQGSTPSANSGKEMALGISSKLIWQYILDTPFVNVAVGYVSCRNQIAQPCGCVGIVL
ncbi:MAG: hypothetical protein ABIT70_09845 [Sulfuriferula sp.]